MGASPFGIKSALLATHAQHVVLIHFPIALSTAAVTGHSDDAPSAAEESLPCMHSRQSFLPPQSQAAPAARIFPALAFPASRPGSADLSSRSAALAFSVFPCEALIILNGDVQF
jgi:hypothetical protein